MKRKLLLLAGSTIFLVVTSLVAWLLRFAPLLGFWANFGIGCGLVVVGVLLLVFSGKNKNILYFVVGINAVAMGFLLRSWYINRGFDNSFWLMLWVVLLAEAYFVIAVLPLLIPFIAKRKGAYLSLFVILSIGAFSALVELTKTTWVSTLGYFGLIQLGFIICLAINEDQPLAAVFVASTYTVAICAGIILFIVLSTGEGGSIFDGLGGGNGGDGGVKSKKKKAPAPPLDDNSLGGNG